MPNARVITKTSICSVNNDLFPPKTLIENYKIKQLSMENYSGHSNNNERLILIFQGQIFWKSLIELILFMQ